MSVLYSNVINIFQHKNSLCGFINYLVEWPVAIVVVADDAVQEIPRCGNCQQRLQYLQALRLVELQQFQLHLCAINCEKYWQSSVFTCENKEYRWLLTPQFRHLFESDFQLHMRLINLTDDFLVRNFLLFLHDDYRFRNEDKDRYTFYQLQPSCELVHQQHCQRKNKNISIYWMQIEYYLRVTCRTDSATSLCWKNYNSLYNL